MFLSVSPCSGKSHLLKLLYNAMSETLIYHCKISGRPTILLLGCIGLSAVYIGGPTNFSSFRIKPGTKSLGLNIQI